jgi:hypothetical protein
VLERRDLEPELLGDAHGGENLIGPIAVTVDQALALQNFDKRVELEIAPRRLRRCARHCVGLRHSGSTLAVGLRAPECVAHDLDHAHSRPRIARLALVVPVGLLDVLAESELDARRGAGEEEVLRNGGSVTQLDDGVLSANRVAASVQDVCDGESTRKLAIQRNLRRIQDIGDADLARDRVGALIDVATDTGMAVRIDEPRCHELPVQLENDGTSRGLKGCADRGDLAILNQTSPGERVPCLESVMTVAPRRR